MKRFAHWRPEALVMSLWLATLLGSFRASNDNSLPSLT